MAAVIYLSGFISYGVKRNYGGKKTVCYIRVFRMTFDLNNRASLKFQINLSNQPFLSEKLHTVEPRCNDPQYNDMPGITNMLCPRFNDLRFNDIPDIPMSF